MKTITKYGKKTRKYTKRTKKYTRTKRRHTIKRIKKSRTLARRNRRGGLKNGRTCESEGCVFHPSIISHMPDRITKLYNSEKLFRKELNNYALFTEADPNYNYHCQLFSDGLLSPDELKNIFGEMPSDLLPNKSYYYIDMEYAGETIGNIPIKDLTIEFKLAFLRFLINVLSLRNNQSQYLVHGDPHSGNICYKMGNANDYIVKYIDITNVIFVDPNKIIEPKTDITFQFSSLIGNLRHVFGFSNVIVNELMPMAMSLPGRKYEDAVDGIIQILERNYEIIQNENEEQSERILDSFQSPQPTKKSRISQPPPISKMKALTLFGDDENDENDENVDITKIKLTPRKLV